MALLFLPCLVSMVLAQEEAISTKWKMGDSWMVKTIYPLPTRENAWSSPLIWTYSVTVLDKDRVVLSVSNQQGLEHLKLTYSRDDGALLRAEIAKSRRGGSSIIGLDFHKGVPVVTSQSAVPFDTPVFPLRVGMSTEFLVKKSVSDNLNAFYKVRQTVHEICGNPPEVSAPLPSGTVDVCITRPDGSVFFRQYWSPGELWPIYGENSNMKYWLVLP